MKRRRLTTEERKLLLSGHKFECHICGGLIQPGQAWEVEHVIPISQGGDDTPENMRPAHARPCHARKTAQDAADTARAKRRESIYLGARESRTPMPFGRKSPWKRRMDGTVVRRDRDA